MAKKNIFLLTIDCFRYDSFTPEITPFLHSLRKKGKVFENAFTTAPFTSASFPSILGGIMPLEYGYYAPLPPQAELIQEKLKKLGYFTIGMHSNAYLSEFFGYHRGFDVFEDFMSFEKREKNKKDTIVRFKKFISKNFGHNSEVYSLLSKFYLGLRLKKQRDMSSQPADEQTGLLKQTLEDCRKKEGLFVWHHYMDTHSPFHPPERLLKKFGFSGDRVSLNSIAHKDPKKISEEEVMELRKMYHASLAFIDENIRDFFAYLEKNGLLKDSIIIITSDHGEEFKDHGAMTHFAKFYDELIHVPLIILDQGSAPEKVDRLVSLRDIPSTILHSIGEGRENSLLDNRYISSVNEVKGECSYSINHNFFEERTNKGKEQKRIYFVRNRDWKYIYNEYEGKRFLYDLKKDPKETKNIENKKVIEELHSLLSIRKKDQEFDVGGLDI